MKRSLLVCLCVIASSPLWASNAARANRQAATTTSSTTSSTSSTSAKKTTARKKHHASTKFVPKQKVPTADRITEIQTALSKGGYYQGDPNGKWDANSIAAMQRFQSANGIEATGKLDAPSLQKLGLGSDIAGVSAPRPPAPAGSVPQSDVPHTAPPQSAAPSSGASSASNGAPNGAPNHSGGAATAASIDLSAGALTSKNPQQ